jgi:hypothetical protein
MALPVSAPTSIIYYFPNPIKDTTAMPSTPHVEKHFQGSEAVRDVVIGMADG